MAFYAGPVPAPPLRSSSRTRSRFSDPDPSSAMAGTPPSAYFAPAHPPSPEQHHHHFLPHQHQHHHEKKHQLRTLRAEYRIALGARTLLKETKRRRQRSVSLGGGGGGGVVDEVLDLAERFEGRVKVDEREVRSRSRSRRGSASTGAGAGAGAGQAAGLGLVEDLVGIAAHQLADHRARSRSRGDGGRGAKTDLEGKEATVRKEAAMVGLGTAAMGLAGRYVERRRSRSRSRSRSRARAPSPSPSLSHSPPSSSPPPRLLTSLTTSQHLTLSHLCAHLLLQSPETHALLGGHEGAARLLQDARDQSSGQGQGQGQEHGHALFGAPLSYLLAHESTDSHHGPRYPGSNASVGTIRIPSFVDHLITALKQADITTSHLLSPPSGSSSSHLRQLSRIISAIDAAGGNDTIIDLAALDPQTLASLLKEFLRRLPEPLLTERLFRVWCGVGHIKNVWLRRRALHLVMCLMPKPNRDLLSILLLFLSFLSSFAHITVLDSSHQLELTNLANVMAPLLLRPPHGRDPTQEEWRGMLGAVRDLVEDSGVYHHIPVEVAHLLHVELPERRDSTSLLSKVEELFRSHPLATASRRTSNPAGRP